MTDRLTIDQLHALHVSDHALVRYLERIRGISLDTYREQIRQLAVANADNEISIGTAYDYGSVIVIELLGLPVVTTILGPGQRAKHKTIFTQLIHVPPDVD